MDRPSAPFRPHHGKIDVGAVAAAVDFPWVTALPLLAVIPSLKLLGGVAGYFQEPAVSAIGISLIIFPARQPGKKAGQLLGIGLISDAAIIQEPIERHGWLWIGIGVVQQGKW